MVFPLKYMKKGIHRGIIKNDLGTYKVKIIFSEENAEEQKFFGIQDSSFRIKKMNEDWRRPYEI